jgi:uncharacterized membrane protein YgdD (TMEM256/DUF423 family)
MDQFFFVLGSLLAGVGVALGAFGEHGLRKRLPPERVETFETGVRYHMYHALALIGVSFAITNWAFSYLPPIAGWLFIAGILLFSGSLYLLSLTGRRWLGVITPLGGVAFILGWLCMALVFYGL